MNKKSLLGRIVLVVLFAAVMFFVLQAVKFVGEKPMGFIREYGVVAIALYVLAGFYVFAKTGFTATLKNLPTRERPRHIASVLFIAGFVALFWICFGAIPGIIMAVLYIAIVLLPDETKSLVELVVRK